LDDSTPYMSELSITPDRLTLGDFKRAFNRKGYSYFCKEWDPNLKRFQFFKLGNKIEYFREVKVEIVNDRQLLRKSVFLIKFILIMGNVLRYLMFILNQFCRQFMSTHQRRSQDFFEGWGVSIFSFFPMLAPHPLATPLQLTHALTIMNPHKYQKLVSDNLQVPF